jgi:PleD family two-component response regulator
MLHEGDRASMDLIKRADEKLYEAKHAGRNRVID